MDDIGILRSIFRLNLPELHAKAKIARVNDIESVK